MEPLTDSGADLKLIIDLVIKNLATINLDAERSDLEKLVVCIQGRAVPWQQVPGLLKLAHGRLQKLRELFSEFKELIENDVEIAELIRQVDSAIQPGDSFSLETATETLDTISIRCSERENQPEPAARIRGLQGLIAAVKHDYQDAAKFYAEAAVTPGLDSEMQWRYQKDRASALVDLGREFADNAALEQANSLLEDQMSDLAPWAQQPGNRATTMQLLGNALGILGQRQGGTRNLENSITAFEESLGERDREQSPFEWAETQNSLGNVLGILGHRLGDEDMLTRSVDAFEQALKERSRWRAARDWATTQNNLAAVLQSQGQRNKDPRTLKRSVETYKEVLEVWTRELMPLEWATTMDNLGTALRMLGEHRKGPRTLEQSVAAYIGALSERSRDRLPQEWAMTQNNLGAALQKLGEREENPETLVRAITAYENALKEWTRDRMPMAWAMTMANLGVARRSLAEVNGDIDSARKAVEELEAVSEIFRNASHAQYSELSIDQVAKARKLVDALTGV